MLCQDSEEVEELVDDYGYEELVEREHDDELAEILGEELLVRWNAKYSYLQIQKKTYFIRQWIRFSCARLDRSS